MLIKAIQKEKEIPFIPPREQMSFLLNLGGTVQAKLASRRFLLMPTSRLWWGGATLQTIATKRKWLMGVLDLSGWFFFFKKQFHLEWSQNKSLFKGAASLEGQRVVWEKPPVLAMSVDDSPPSLSWATKSKLRNRDAKKASSSFQTDHESHWDLDAPVPRASDTSRNSLFTSLLWSSRSGHV